MGLIFLITSCSSSENGTHVTHILILSSETPWDMSVAGSEGILSKFEDQVRKPIPSNRN